MMAIEKKHDDIQADVAMRIRQFRDHLESLERRVNDRAFVLNDLGELQAVGNILDCRIASLATLRMLMR